MSPCHYGKVPVLQSRQKKCAKIPLEINNEYKNAEFFANFCEFCEFLRILGMITQLPYEITSLICTYLNPQDHWSLKCSSLKFKFIQIPHFFSSPQWLAFVQLVGKKFQLCASVLKHPQSTLDLSDFMMIYADLPEFAKKKAKSQMKLVLQTISIFMDTRSNEQFWKKIPEFTKSKK